MDKAFNLIINGIGGQGVITLLTLVDEAAFVDGYQVRSSELHGLSQRGGSVETHARFGKKVNSPLIENGKADLIISLEALEGLRGATKAGSQTTFLINDQVFAFQGSLTLEEIKERFFSIKNKSYFVPASTICEEKLQNDIGTGVFLFGYAVAKKLIPIKKKSVLQAIDNIVPEKYKDFNIKAFELGYAYN